MANQQQKILSDADLGIVGTPTQTNQNAAAPQQPTQPPNKSVLSDADLGLLSARPDLRPTYDVPKSALSAAERMPIGFVNAPADIMNFVSDALEKGLATTVDGAINLYNSAVGDTDTPEGKRRLEVARGALSKAHETNLATRPYSTSQIATEVDPYARQVLPVGPAYQSKTGPGQFTQTAIDVAGPGMFGKGKLATKLLRGATSVLGVEAADTAADYAGLTDPTTRTALSMLGGITGGGVGEMAVRGKNVVGNIVDPTQAANERIAQVIKQAREEGRAPTDAEIQQALASNAPLTAYDLAGERSPELVNPAATGPERDALLQINKAIQDRGAAAFGRVNDGLDNILGRKVDAGETRAKISEQQGIDNKANYEKALSDPLAANMESPTVMKLKDNPLIQGAYNDAVKTLGGYSPSLKFWDQVKRNLDDASNAAFRRGEGNLGSDLSTVRNQLRDDLKSQNPTYADALSGASDFFKAKNAVDAGYKYASKFNTFDAAQVRQAISKFSPDQLALFQEGFVSALKDKAQGGADKLLTGLDKASSVGKLNDVFPSKNGTQARQIQSMVDLENMTRDVDTIKLAQNLGESSQAGAGNRMLEFAVSGASGLGLGAFQGPTTGTIAALGTFLATEATRGVLSAAQKNVARQVAETLASGDAGKIAELSKLAETTPAVKTTLQKLEPFLAHTALTMTGVNAANANQRPQRASGGSVIDKKADALVSESLRNQKLIANHTEQMLSMPDDAVMQALHVARSVAA